MEGVALMIEAMLRGRWIDAHAADGVDDRGRVGVMRMVIVAGTARPGRRNGREIFCGIGGEFGAAAGRAEMEGLALVLEAVLRRRRINRHAADRIFHLCGEGRRVVMTATAAVRIARGGRIGTVDATRLCSRLVVSGFDRACARSAAASSGLTCCDSLPVFGFRHHPAS